MINLLPYKEKRAIERIRAIRFARTVAGGFILFGVAAGVLLLPTLMTINSRFSIANNQIKSLEINGSMVSDVDITSLGERARVAQSKLSVTTTVQPTEYVEIVRANTPAGIFVERFAVNESRFLEVSGMAQSREILQSFIKTLEQNEKVALVDSPVSNFIKTSNSPFRIVVSFK